MSAPITIDPEVLRQGAAELEGVSEDTRNAAQTAEGAAGGMSAFGASPEAQTLAEAWMAMARNRGQEMQALAEGVKQLADRVHQAAAAFEQEDTDNAHDMERHGEGAGRRGEQPSEGAGRRGEQPGEGRGAGEQPGEGRGAGEPAESEGN
ncbi:type VII secretion target [Saccharomonospora sp. NB11]|jgi:uncharacterized protein YukE|uniref:type VII secretion target n=1 Tax=Saccharomonospora sp. NB11 TaxID=1642298 RepID=UPI0018D12D00|nr:type VII secretion target [Saccharomonospora sp. NB11]